MHPNCYDKKTLVFTKAGWKLFKDVTLNDEFLSLNPETLETEFLKPLNIIHYHITDDMVHVYNEELDVCITQDHDCFVKYNNKYCFLKPNQLNDDCDFLISKNNINENLINLKECTVEKIIYDDMVYCVELPKYHTLWTKRNGKTSWNGNCKCTYVSVWKRNRTPPEKPFVVNLINEETYNWAYDYKGKHYQLQGNTPMSRDDFLHEIGVPIDELSEEEYAFFKIYTDNGDAAINGYLRGLLSKEDAIKRWEDVNDKLLDKGVLDHILLFDDSLNLIDTIFSKHGKTLKKDIIVCRRERERFMGRNGKTTYEDKGFTSMSICEYTKVDEYGDELNYILIPKGTKLLYVEEITSSPEDYETLFLPNIHLDKVEDLGNKKKVWKLP
ncbi:ADP-ribosyltransferase exoenzyme [Methanobrevibacter olleyae]|uniref:ADP-ribosyltransferase exoenzyme n=1 Tax=Methanobrevibacter olleyae TaxID=294671 RepID=A0A1I4JJC3_METOL|nr:ADP-ribosyltransferase [Methanobrevibacter olleyae]SFL66705.1 ADP-ribosyltransferase exoenzyme [Methanobrevibacter olleyae]